MNVPFQDLRGQYLELKNDIDRAVQRTLDSGWYILGKECEQFENAFKQFLVGDDQGYVVGVNSGTDALKLSLLAAGVGPGDEVITAANTAIPTAAAICSIGAVPVFCDADPDSWLMDHRLLPQLITPKTKALIPVHLYGAPCDMDALDDTTRKHRLAIIEDVAQAAGSTYKGRQCGTIADFGAFSFYPSKNLGAFGDGGAIFVRSEEKRDALVMLRNYGQRSRYKADMTGGENSRLDEIQAAILSAKLPHLNQWNNNRRRLAASYRRALTDADLPLSMIQEQKSGDTAYHLFVIKLRIPSLRDRLMNYLHEQGIQTLVHYPMQLQNQPAFSGFKRGLNPVSEELCSSIISLPFHQYLKREDIEVVVAAIKEFMKHYRD